MGFRLSKLNTVLITFTVEIYSHQEGRKKSTVLIVTSIKLFPCKNQIQLGARKCRIKLGCCEDVWSTVQMFVLLSIWFCQRNHLTEDSCLMHWFLSSLWQFYSSFLPCQLSPGFSRALAKTYDLHLTLSSNFTEGELILVSFLGRD